MSNYLLLNKTAKTITSAKNRYRSVSNITECVAAQQIVKRGYEVNKNVTKEDVL